MDRFHFLVDGSLTELDLDNIKMYSIVSDGALSWRLYNRIRSLFSHRLTLDTLYNLHKRMAELSQVTEVIYDCCINSCCCFTGRFLYDCFCSYCNEPRFDSDGKARQRFRYLPLTARLKGLYLNIVTSELMDYRSKYTHNEEEISDVFDGIHYRKLLEEVVKIDGTAQGHRFFSESRDLALGIMTDGFQIFKRVRNGSQTCWPIIMLNFNLPPEIRTRLSNIVPVAIIPGPNAPKDFNSFFRPLIEESKILAAGVRAFDARRKEAFTFHAYPISCHGDMPAIKHLMNFKGHNAVCPCRACEIKAIRDPSNPRAPYYVPLTPPASFTGNSQGWDPDNLPLRTDERIAAQLNAIQTGRTVTERTNLRKKFGINDVCDLTEIPSIKSSHSFGHEAMHLWLENTAKNMIAHWQGRFKDLNEGQESYRISDAQWSIIGKETEAAGTTIPSSFGRRTPNIWTERHNFTAEDWSFWFIHLAPHLLKGRFQRPKYYAHFMKLNNILKIVFQYTITRQQLANIHRLIIEWVDEYEQYVILTLPIVYAAGIY